MMKEVFHGSSELESVLHCGNCGAPLPEASTQKQDPEKGTIHIICEHCGYIQTIQPIA